MSQGLRAITFIFIVICLVWLLPEVVIARYKVFCDEHGLNIVTEKSGSSAILGGLSQNDFIKFRGQTKGIAGGYRYRRFRLHAYFVLNHYWLLNYRYQFAGPPELEDTNIGYQDLHHIIFLLGQSDPYFGLSNASNIPALVFWELSLPINTFAPPYSPGSYINLYTQHFSFMNNVFSPGPKVNISEKVPIGTTFRLVYSPIHTLTHVIHVAVSLWRQNANSDREVEFGTVPEAVSRNAFELVDTGEIINTRNYFISDLELLYLKGPFEAQAELTNTRVNRFRGSPDLNFSGYYIVVNYFLTGESRLYDWPSADFIGITKIKGRHGALQVAARYSYINLTNRDIRGGKEHNFTFGLNWYPTQWSVFLFNYIYALASPDFAGKRRNVNIFGIRYQIMFD